MGRKNLIVGMDVGTSQVRVVVAEPRMDGTVNVIGAGLSPSEGIKKGIIIDLDRTVESIATAVEEAERMVPYKIDSAYVGLAGLNVELINNRGVVAVASDDREIMEEDVTRVLQATRVIALPSDREIVDIISREFIVDGYDGIRDPVGMLGVRLEVDAMIITSPITTLRNLTRCVNRAGINVNGLVLQSLANAEIALSSDEKELGVFLLDIGGGTTELALFQYGKLMKLAVLPIGGDHITNDLAMALRVSALSAEALKIDFGCAALSLADEDKVTGIKSVGGRERYEVSEKDLAGYIEPRVLEIFQLAQQEMVKMSPNQWPPAGIVLTGGVSAMHGVAELARLFFNSGDQVRVAEPEYLGVNDVYGTATGVVYYAQKYLQTGFAPAREKLRKGISFIQRLKDWFSEIWE